MIFAAFVFDINAAMEINLSESDIKEYEKEGKIPIRITATRGSLGKEGNVTLHVVPLTLTQFRATGRSLPKSLSMQEYDPAEAGELMWQWLTHVVSSEWFGHMYKP